MSASPNWPLTIYYDASCPLCRAEMEAMKARDAAGVLRLVDCSAAGFDEGTIKAPGVTRAAMLIRIHAQDAAGRWLVGVPVFAAVYRAAGLRVPARLFESPWLRPFFDRAYPWIADHRYLLSRLGLSRFFHLVALRGAAPARPCAACARPSDSARHS